jgi:hypothetical protein
VKRSDILLRAAGLSFTGTVFTWMLTLALALVCEDASHLPAHLTTGKNQVQWIVFPGVATAIWLVVPFLLAAVRIAGENNQ